MLATKVSQKLLIDKKRHQGSVWMDEWKSEMMENCAKMEKWEGGKLFCLVGEKNGRMKNVIYIN